MTVWDSPMDPVYLEARVLTTASLRQAAAELRNASAAIRAESRELREQSASLRTTATEEAAHLREQ